MQISKRNVASALIIGSLLIAPVAEAKRVGGGKSYGMSRNTTSSQNSAGQNSAGQNLSGQSANQNSATPQNASQPQRSGPGVGGLVAAGAAGAAAGYMLGHSNDAQAQNSATAAPPTQSAADNNFSWLWIALLAIAAFFLFRRFAAKRANATHNPFAPNNSGQGQSTKPDFATQARTQRPIAPDQNQRANTTLTNPASSSHSSSNNTNVFGQQVGAVGGGAYNHSGQQLPDGTEPAAFLRQARAKFLHLQSMNSASNIEEVRRYFTPDMYSEIRQEILSNDELAEFPQLIAHVVHSGTENGQYVASVQFSGTVSETLNAQAVPFSEVWHFVKAADSGEWLVAGIQQG